jgi:ribonuclease VapC
MTIAVDTSAIVAMIKGEPEEERLRTRLARENVALMSTGNILELQLVAAGARSLATWPDVEKLLETYRIIAHPFDERQLNIAREAAMRFGKGRHEARLNFGDCFAYALAKSEDIPLLCTGGDFAKTDVALA